MHFRISVHYGFLI
jgi:transposase InsO family protein